VTKIPILQGTIEEEKEWTDDPHHPYKKSVELNAENLPLIMLVKGDEVMMRADSQDYFTNDIILKFICNGGYKNKNWRKPLVEDIKNKLGTIDGKE